jgi:hypothetical protein
MYAKAIQSEMNTNQNEGFLLLYAGFPGAPGEGQEEGI